MDKFAQEKTTLLELPILKHFDESKGEIALSSNTLKKGEKSIFWILALGLLGVGGYLTWTYIIPPLFTMLGQAIALSATGVFLIFLVMMFPVIMKGLRFMTKNLHKALIQSNPFNELEEQKQKMVKNREVFKNTKAKLKGLKNEMEIEATKSEKEAKSFQEDVLSLQRQSEKLKSAMDEMVRLNGAAAKDTDEYVALQSELARKLPSLEKHDYNTIDKLMRRIASKHSITGKALHDLFVKKYHRNPDSWIKNKLDEGGDNDLQQEVDKFCDWACKRLHLKSIGFFSDIFKILYRISWLIYWHIYCFKYINLKKEIVH